MDMFWIDEYDMMWRGVMEWAHDDYELWDIACGKWETEGA